MVMGLPRLSRAEKAQANMKAKIRVPLLEGWEGGESPACWTVNPKPWNPVEERVEGVGGGGRAWDRGRQCRGSALKHRNAGFRC